MNNCFGQKFRRGLITLNKYSFRKHSQAFNAYTRCYVLESTVDKQFYGRGHLLFFSPVSTNKETHFYRDNYPSLEPDVAKKEI